MSEIKSGNGDGDSLSGQTGVEYDLGKKFKWTIKNFALFQKDSALVNSQKIEFDVEATTEIPSMTWKLSLSYNPPGRTCSAYWIFSYDCRVHGVKSPALVAPPFYKAELSYINKSGESKECITDLQKHSKGNWHIGQGDWALGFIDNALVLDFALEFYRTCKPMIDEVPLVSLSRKRWNKRHEHSKKNYLVEMLKTGHLSDVKIISMDGQEFSAHKFILKAGSDVFEAMFRNDMAESTSGVVKLDDMSGRAVKFLLHFLYSSELLPISANVDETNGDDSGSEEKATIEEVLYLAKKYGFDEVVAHLDENFQEICNEKNSRYLLKLCKTYSLTKGKEAVMKFMMSKQAKVLEELAFLQI